jgi:hypothetical protein
LEKDHVIQFYDDTFINSMPWSTRAFDNTGKGETAIGAIDFFSLGASVVYYDNIILQPVVEYEPQLLTVFRGFYSSGGLQDVYSSDDAYLKFNPGITIIAEDPPVWLVFDFEASADAEGNVRAIVETSANTPGLTQTVQAFNWTTQRFDDYSSSSVSFNRDSVDYLEFPSNDYVHPISGAVQLGIRVNRAGPKLLFPWTFCVDTAVICIDP